MRAIGFAICIVAVALHVGYAAESVVDTSEVALDAASDTHDWRLHSDEAYALYPGERPHLWVSYNDWEIGGAFTYDYFRSIEGADRHAGRVTNDFPLTDQRATFTLWTAYILLNDRWKLALSFEHYYRQGELLEVSDTTRENRYMANVTLRF